MSPALAHGPVHAELEAQRVEGARLARRARTARTARSRGSPSRRPTAARPSSRRPDGARSVRSRPSAIASTLGPGADPQHDLGLVVHLERARRQAHGARASHERVPGLEEDDGLPVRVGRARPSRGRGRRSCDRCRRSSACPERTRRDPVRRRPRHAGRARSGGSLRRPAGGVTVRVARGHAAVEGPEVMSPSTVPDPNRVRWVVPGLIGASFVLLAVLNVWRGVQPSGVAPEDARYGRLLLDPRTERWVFKDPTTGEALGLAIRDADSRRAWISLKRLPEPARAGPTSSGRSRRARAARPENRGAVVGAPGPAHRPRAGRVHRAARRGRARGEPRGGSGGPRPDRRRS